MMKVFWDSSMEKQENNNKQTGYSYLDTFKQYTNAHTQKQKQQHNMHTRFVQ